MGKEQPRHPGGRRSGGSGTKPHTSGRPHADRHPPGDKRGGRHGRPSPAGAAEVLDTSAFLPTTAREMRERGWDQVDFVYVCGDAYVDHPSFGAAIICRLLEAHGFKVGMIAQPDWRDPASVDVFGRPRLAFLVSSGNMDSMVNHYTVAKRRRDRDAYSPGGQAGLRPDHAVVVYGNLIRRVHKDVPVILGGIEASLRRLAHYDYWSNSLKRSILLDAGADLLIYGMGEKAMVAVAEALDAGIDVHDLCFIPGTVYRARGTEQCDEPVMLPAFEAMQAQRTEYARSFGMQLRGLNPFLSHAMVEEYPHGVFVIQNPPSEPLSTEELDRVYELPYARTYHPSYEAAGGVPAIEEVRFSLAVNRGCMGDCAFCALNFHQGRIIQARSDESILAEAEAMTCDPHFKGYIHDVGGPTANFMAPACAKQTSRGACLDRRCLSPTPCKALKANHTRYVKLLRKLRALPGVKKVFVRSGIRFDYALLDADHTFIRELVEHHVSGQLRLAPEHVSDAVLNVMGKPSNDVYRRFCEEFERTTRACGKEQYILPYLMSSHPGSTLAEAVELAEFCRDMGYNPEQVQDFYPTPSTVSTCIYYTGLDPRTMEPVYCPTDPHEKAMQRALIQYRDPKNRDLVVEALRKAGRTDLIGYGPKCLVRPERHDERGGRDEKAGGKQANKSERSGSRGANAGGNRGQGRTGRASRQSGSGRR